MDVKEFKMQGAWFAGQRACYNGMSRGDNPYEDDWANWDLWDDGWMTAKQKLPNHTDINQLFEFLAVKDVVTSFHNEEWLPEDGENV